MTTPTKAAATRNRNRKLARCVAILDGDDQLAAEAPMSLPQRPGDVWAMVERGEAPSLADLASALRGMRMPELVYGMRIPSEPPDPPPPPHPPLPDEYCPPLLDYIASQLERLHPRDGHPTNEHVAMARLAIGRRVSRWHRVLRDRYHLRGGKHGTTPPARVRAWNIVIPMAPLAAAFKIVAHETGLTARRVEDYARQVRKDPAYLLMARDRALREE